jgi:hypothetical protein
MASKSRPQKSTQTRVCPWWVIPIPTILFFSFAKSSHQVAVDTEADGEPAAGAGTKRSASEMAAGGDDPADAGSAAPGSSQGRSKLRSIAEAKDPYVCPGLNGDCWHRVVTTGGYWSHVRDTHKYERKQLNQPGFEHIREIFVPAQKLQHYQNLGIDTTYRGSDPKQRNALQRIEAGISKSHPGYHSWVYEGGAKKARRMKEEEEAVTAMPPAPPVVLAGNSAGTVVGPAVPTVAPPAPVAGPSNDTGGLFDHIPTLPDLIGDDLDDLPPLDTTIFDTLGVPGYEPATIAAPPGYVAEEETGEEAPVPDQFMVMVTQPPAPLDNNGRWVLRWCWEEEANPKEGA